MNRRALVYGVVVLLIVVAAALAGPTILAAVNPTPQPITGQAGIANPASTYCVERGYRLDIRTGPGGQSGVCVFLDGSECDEWEFFRGECGVKWATPTK